MIKNIVFDLSRVLIEFNTEYYSRLAGVDDSNIELFRNEVYRSVPWLRLERGDISYEDAINEMCNHLPKSLYNSVQLTVRHWWEQSLRPVNGMELLLKELKNSGYMLYVLSNARKCVYEYINKIPGIQFIDGYLFSIDVGFLKPQTEIFHCFFNKFDINPEECYFIDDATANVEAASSVGMKGFVFRNDVEALKKELHKEGIIISN